MLEILKILSRLLADVEVMIKNEYLTQRNKSNEKTTLRNKSLNLRLEPRVLSEKPSNFRNLLGKLVS